MPPKKKIKFNVKKITYEKRKRIQGKVLALGKEKVLEKQTKGDKILVQSRAIKEAIALEKERYEKAISDYTLYEELEEKQERFRKQEAKLEKERKGAQAKQQPVAPPRLRRGMTKEEKERRKKKRTQDDLAARRKAVREKRETDLYRRNTAAAKKAKPGSKQAYAIAMSEKRQRNRMKYGF